MPVGLPPKKGTPQGTATDWYNSVTNQKTVATDTAGSGYVVSLRCYDFAASMYWILLRTSQAKWIQGPPGSGFAPPKNQRPNSGL